MISKKISLENCIFIPREIYKESRGRFERKTVDIFGSRIDLAKEKIEDCSYPVEELSSISHKTLHRSFSDRQDVGDTVRGVMLLAKAVKIREQRILPTLRIYQRLADNCRRDSDRLLNSGMVSDTENFKRYREELYEREQRLKQVAQSRWQNLVDNIYQTIKIQNNCFIVNSFSDVDKEIEQIEVFVMDCQAGKELYGNLAYKSFT